MLLKNERNEWELPGGKIEPSETPEECVVREITEETQWAVTAGPLLDSWIYFIQEADRHVFIVTYGCYPDSDAAPVLSDEHKDARLFREDEIAALRMPDGYRKSIMNWFALLRAENSESRDGQGERHRAG